jgi:hypothetical protein
MGNPLDAATRHAVSAPKIAPVGDGNPHVPDMPVMQVHERIHLPDLDDGKYIANCAFLEHSISLCHEVHIVKWIQ